MKASDNPQRSLRQDRQTVDSVLDELDGREEGAAQRDDGKAARQYARRRYRLTIQAELEQPGGAVLRYAVPTRNLSRNGIGFLIGQFVYPNTICTVHLISPHNYSQKVSGRVVHCRYLVGTASLHEVGVRFYESIDVSMFEESTGSSERVRILVADDDPIVHPLIKLFLKDFKTDLTFVTDGEQAVNTALSGHYDLVLMDLEMPGLDGLAATRELRQRGYAGPIIAITATVGESSRKRCLEAGCTGFLAKPLSHEAIAQLVEGMVCEPLQSSLANQPEMHELIDQFIESLSGTVRDLETALDAADTATLERTARLLKGQGTVFGFAKISEAATELEEALMAGDEPPLIREKLDSLLKLCRAARPVTDS